MVTAINLLEGGDILAMVSVDDSENRFEIRPHRRLLNAHDVVPPIDQLVHDASEDIGHRQSNGGHLHDDVVAYWFEDNLMGI